MFGRKGLGPGSTGGTGPAAPAGGISSIIVPESALASDDRHALPGAVVDFVNHALRNAMFERSELAPEAMQAFHVDYYIAQVNNGGHGQFAHNSGWHNFIRDDIGDGLRRIGFLPALSLFEEYLAFFREHPDRFAKSMEASGFGTEDPVVESIDQRFYGGVGDGLATALRDWIAGLPMLQALPPDEYRELMKALPTHNPKFAERQRERAGAATDETRGDPVHQAMRYICFLAPPGTGFRRWHSGSKITNDKGQSGTGFYVETDAGMGRIAFFPDLAVLWINGEGNRLEVPMDMVVAHLQRNGLALPPEMTPA